MCDDVVGAEVRSKSSEIAALSQRYRRAKASGDTRQGQDCMFKDNSPMTSSIRTTVWSLCIDVFDIDRHYRLIGSTTVQGTNDIVSERLITNELPKRLLSKQENTFQS